MAGAGRLPACTEYGILGPVTSVAAIRRIVGAGTRWRCLVALLAVAIALAGLPDWEMHAHAIADQAQHHSHAPHAPDAPDPTGEHHDPLVAHLHDAASCSAALPDLDLVRTCAIRAPGRQPVFEVAALHGRHTTPPQRPPIV